MSKNASIKAVAFDLDGTILDTLPDLTNAMNLALKAHGREGHSLEVYGRLVGRGNLALTRSALPPEVPDGEAVREVYERFLVEYEKCQTERSAPYPGIIDLMKTLKERGLPLAVISNKNHPNVATILKHYFPGLIDHVRGVTADRPPKPDPTGGRELLKTLGLAPADVCFVGDSVLDMRYGKTVMGFRPVVGVSWGYCPRGELEKEGPDLILDKPSDFLPLLDGTRT
ncbi:MAG: HAD family hydrolase [Deltaproteobacteria bacterium]|jgi:phosphoglycolate phosphatase|nr:HAD family hydrolase [Deltaproteobacteria bacterium]